MKHFLRTAAKSMCAGGLYYTGMLAAWQLARRVAGEPRVHVLGFHRVVPDFVAATRTALPPLCVSRETFEAQLSYVARHMDVLDLETAALALRGAHRLSRNACVITFDDGYRDVYTQAFPILRRLGLPAAVFISTGYVSTPKLFPHDRVYSTLLHASDQEPRPASPRAERWAELARRRGPHFAVETAARTLPARHLLDVAEELEAAYGAGDPPDDDGHCLSWEQCQEMAQHGIEFGSHSVSHTPLAHEPPGQMLRELRDSFEEIEQRLPRRVRFVAYPNGVYSDEVMDTCRDLGVSAAFTTEDHPNRPGHTNPMCVGRKLLWEAHGRGFGRRPSRALVAQSLENVTGELGFTGVPGRYPQTAGEESWQR
jgi:peptidoglycan/xylan/chitin deacetylase (PgdA/CDA1 family)